MSSKENQNFIKIKEWYENKSGNPWPQITIPTPTPKSWGIDISDNELTFKMTREAACSNMQTYEAAFESWLVFFVKLGVDNVCFQWEPIDRATLKKMLDKKDINAKNDLRKKALHYNRFLYRVLKFNEVFGQEGSWFHIEETCLKALNDSEFIQDYREGKLFYVNRPSADRKSNVDEDSSIISELDMTGSEAEYEKKFLEKWIKSGKCEIVDRQLPVGLFKDEVLNDDTRVFPGGKGAIDLWTINRHNEALNIFELKCPGIKQIGIFSELFFYSMFMLDIINKKFVDGKSSKNSSGFFESNLVNRNPSEICAHYLVTIMHPALVICELGTENDMVNEAMRLNGIPVSFKLTKYSFDVTAKVFE